MIHWYNADTLTASPSEINWVLFCALCTFASVLYLELAPRYAARGEFFLSLSFPYPSSFNQS